MHSVDNGSVSCLPPAGKVESALWAGQDLEGAGDENQLPEGGQGRTCSIIDSALPPADVCLGPNDVHLPTPPPQICPRTSWRVCWTFLASRWNSTRSSQATATRSLISKGCCRRTWSPSGPRSPGTPRYFAPYALRQGLANVFTGGPQWVGKFDWGVRSRWRSIMVTQPRRKIKYIME